MNPLHYLAQTGIEDRVGIVPEIAAVVTAVLPVPLVCLYLRFVWVPGLA